MKRKRDCRLHWTRRDKCRHFPTRRKRSRSTGWDMNWAIASSWQRCRMTQCTLKRPLTSFSTPPWTRSRGVRKEARPKSNRHRACSKIYHKTLTADRARISINRLKSGTTAWLERTSLANLTHLHLSSWMIAIPTSDSQNEPVRSWAHSAQRNSASTEAPCSARRVWWPILRWWILKCTRRWAHPACSRPLSLITCRTWQQWARLAHLTQLEEVRSQSVIVV